MLQHASPLSTEASNTAWELLTNRMSEELSGLDQAHRKKWLIIRSSNFVLLCNLGMERLAVTTNDSPFVFHCVHLV